MTKKIITVMCFVSFCMLGIAINADAGNTNPFKSYSQSDEKLGNVVQGSKKPSARSASIQSELVGAWKHVSTPSDDVSEITPKSLVFRKDGSVEYSYEQKDGKKLIQKAASYQVFHKGTPKNLPGRPPDVIVKNTDDGRVIPLVRLSIDYDNRFPKTFGKVLRFHDVDGSEYIFVRDKDLATASQTEVSRRSEDEPLSNTAENKKTVTRDALLTRELSNRLKVDELNEEERNKAVLRLMNEGDATCVPVLIEHIKGDHTLVVRQNAIRALGKIGNKQAVPSLLDILENPVEGNTQDEGENEAVLRRNAVLALGEIGDTSALSVLKKVAKSDEEYQSVREFAEITIRKIKEKK